MPIEKVRTPLDYFAEQFTRFQIYVPVKELIENGATAKVVKSEGLVFLYFNYNGIYNGTEVRQRYYIFAEDDHSVLIKLEDKKIIEGFYDRSLEVKTANSKGEVSKINATERMIGWDPEDEKDPDLVFIVLNTQATKEILLYQKISEEGEEDSQENTTLIKSYFTTRRIDVGKFKNKLFLEMAKRKGNIDDAREAFIEGLAKNIKANTAYVLDFSDMRVSTTTKIRYGKRSAISKDEQKIPGMLIVSIGKGIEDKRVTRITLTEIPDDLKNTQLEFTNMCNCRFLEAFVSIKTNGAASESRDQGPYY